MGVLVEVIHTAEQVTTALPELCNHNINNKSAVHATRSMVWTLSRTVLTAQCQNWQITCTQN
jgi:hypothetical protein